MFMVHTCVILTTNTVANSTIATMHKFAISFVATFLFVKVSAYLLPKGIDFPKG